MNAVNVAVTLAAVAIGTLLGVCMTVERSLQTDIEALKLGQQDIQKSMAEAKVLLTRRNEDRGAIAQAPPSSAALAPSSAKISLDNALVQGDESAPVTLVEFTDFQCPYCRALFTQTMPQLVTDYVGTGKLRYVVKDFPLASIHANALKAAEAVHCADAQGKGWELRARLFQNQDQLVPEALTEHARALSLDQVTFANCLNGGQFSEVVQKSIAEGQAAGVNGTPTLFLGVIDRNTRAVTTFRSIVGAQSIAVIRAAIDEQLSQRSERRNGL